MGTANPQYPDFGFVNTIGYSIGKEFISTIAAVIFKFVFISGVLFRINGQLIPIPTINSPKTI
jgi:hypothetical protein